MASGRGHLCFPGDWVPMSSGPLSCPRVEVQEGQHPGPLPLGPHAPRPSGNKFGPGLSPFFEASVSPDLWGRGTGQPSQLCHAAALTFLSTVCKVPPSCALLAITALVSCSQDPTPMVPVRKWRPRGDMTHPHHRPHQAPGSYLYPQATCLDLSPHRPLGCCVGKREQRDSG